MKKVIFLVLIASFMLVGCSSLSTHNLSGEEFRSPFVMSMNPENAKQIEFTVFYIYDADIRYQTVGVPINNVLVLKRQGDKQYDYNLLMLGGASDTSGDKYNVCLIIVKTEEELVRIKHFIDDAEKTQILMSLML